MDRKNTYGKQVIKQIEELIRSNCEEDHSLTSLGERFGFNAAYLGRLFKSVTGTGFSRYVTNVRIQQATSLLYETNMSVNAIRSHIGYSSNQHFNKMFKKHIGLTPAEYRQYIRENECQASDRMPARSPDCSGYLETRKW